MWVLRRRKTVQSLAWTQSHSPTGMFHVPADSSGVWGCTEGSWPSKAVPRPRAQGEPFPGPGPSHTGSYKGCREASKSLQGSVHLTSKHRVKRGLRAHGREIFIRWFKKKGCVVWEHILGSYDKVKQATTTAITGNSESFSAQNFHVSDQIPHFLPPPPFFAFLRSHPRHMEVPRLGVKSELQLPAYTTATAMQDPSHIRDLHHSPWQHQILNPLSNARDQNRIFIDTNWVHYHWATTGSPVWVIYNKRPVLPYSAFFNTILSKAIENYPTLFKTRFKTTLFKTRN